MRLVVVVVVLLLSFALPHDCWIFGRNTVCTTSSVMLAARCLHCTAGSTTGCVNYANESSQAALERSSQDADDVIRLTRAARRLCGQ